MSTRSASHRPRDPYRPRDSKATAPEMESLFPEEPAEPPATFAQEELSDLIVGDVFGALDGYRDGAIEDWMIFLSPLQRRAVDRAMNGPAPGNRRPGDWQDGRRAPSCGSVRARSPAWRSGPDDELRQEHPRNSGRFVRASRAGCPRTVAFRHIHDLAIDLLGKRDVRVNPDWNAAKARFDRCHSREPQRAANFVARGLTAATYGRRYPRHRGPRHLRLRHLS